MLFLTRPELLAILCATWACGLGAGGVLGLWLASRLLHREPVVVQRTRSGLRVIQGGKQDPQPPGAA